jgi:hypothetical protein
VHVDADRWKKLADPLEMLLFRGKHFSYRKQSLFDAACCRRIWRFLRSPCLKEAIEVLERHVDNGDEISQLQEAHNQASEEWQTRAPKAYREAAWAVIWATAQSTEFFHLASTAASSAVAWDRRRRQLGPSKHERRTQAMLLRDIVGNPFARPNLGVWKGNKRLVSLALAIYEQRKLPSGKLDNQRLAVLADFLEEEGCRDVDILSHLRTQRVHVRGCWVIDLILKRS